MTYAPKTPRKAKSDPCPNGGAHRWHIPSPDEGEPLGRCAHCNAARMFSNVSETTFTELNERRYDRSLRRREPEGVLAEERMGA